METLDAHQSSPTTEATPQRADLLITLMHTHTMTEYGRSEHSCAAAFDVAPKVIASDPLRPLPSFDTFGVEF